jgi:hypothetical protein
MDVFQFESAEAAELILEKVGSSPCFLFTDVNLAGSMTGIELANIAASRYPRMRVVVISRLGGRGTMEPVNGSSCGLGNKLEPSMTDDTEIGWHKEQIAKNRALLQELEAGNTAGGDVFAETQSEIDHLQARSLNPS